MRKKIKPLGLELLELLTKPLLFFIPVVFMVFVQFVPYTNFYILELDLYIHRYGCGILLAIFYVIYTYLMGKIEDLYEDYSRALAVYLLPVSFVLLGIFAQYHFKTALVLLGLCILTTVSFCVLLECAKKRMPENQRKKLANKSFQKHISGCTLGFLVKAYNIILLPAALIGGYCFVTQMPLARPSIGEANLAVFETDADGENFKIEYMEQFSGLSEAEWQNLNCGEKITILQKLVNLETTCLNINPVKIASRRLNMSALGEYANEGSLIYIDYKFLATAKADECIRVICHEVRHAYQFYVVEMLDWDNEQVQRGYFYREARRWKNEMENYASGDDDFDKYYQQAMEVDARDYAVKASEFYMDYIDSK